MQTSRQTYRRLQTSRQTRRQSAEVMYIAHLRPHAPVRAVFGWEATEHSHQPPDKAKPSPGNQRAKSSTHKFNFALGSCTTSGLDLGSQHARQERALPIRSNPFLLPGGEYPMQTNADLLGKRSRTGVRGDREGGRVRPGGGQALLALDSRQPTKAIIWSVEWRLHLQSERPLIFYATS